jgi:beta-lactamase superfamily II metal-dependent hydrolase
LKAKSLSSGSKSPQSPSEKAVKIHLARRDSQSLAKPSQQALTLLHLDVDQGACTLVLYTSPKGKRWTAVIDGGHGNPGRGQIVRYLDELEIEKIDALFLSHHDADHADGLVHLLHHHSALIKEGGSLYVPYLSGTHKIKKYDCVTRVAAVNNQILFENKGFSITALLGNMGRDENGNSLALLIKLGKFKYLTCGDLPTTQGEDAVAQRVGQIDAIYCSHHGSAHSTSRAMLDSLKNPPIAVISAGRNGYGHPNSETLERFPKDPAKFRLYLTGCQFNRKYVNPAYYETEQNNLTKMINHTWMIYSNKSSMVEAKNLAATLIDGLFFCIEEKHDEENAKGLKEKVQELLQDILDGGKDKFTKGHCEAVIKMVSECFETKKGDVLPLFGVVSGTPEKMGAVGIRIQPAPLAQFVDVGYCYSGSGVWKWQHRWNRGDEDRLVFEKEINESAATIDDAIPTIPNPILASPKKFTGWKAIRASERVPFSLSTRTPRQPALVVSYICRWCQKRESKNMVLVECEYCSSRGILVAYHKECLMKAMNGETIKLNRRSTFGGAPYFLKAYIAELMEQHESEDTPVLIPAQFEACYQCGVFRGGKKGQWFLAIVELEEVEDAIRLRRQTFSKFIIGDTDIFTIDSMLEDFYTLQPEL